METHKKLLPFVTEFEKHNQGQMVYLIQILREIFKDTTRKGKSHKDVFVKAKQPHSMSREVY